MGISFTLGLNSRPAIRGIKKFGTAIDKSITRVGRLGGALRKIPAIGRILGAAGIVAGFTKATMSAAKFEDQVGRINTILRLNRTGVEKLTDDISKMSVEFGISTERLTEAGFQIASAGVSGEKAMEVLRTASIGAVAGFSDVAEVTKGLLTAMEVFGEDAMSAMDKMTLANEKGRITTDAFARSVGLAGPIAAQLNLSLEDVSLAMAKITQGGVEAANATTALRGAFRIFSTKEVRELVGDVRELGLVEMLERVKTLREGNAAVFEKLFMTEERGKIGILQLIREGGVEIGKLKDLNMQVGLTAKQFKRAQTTALRMRQSQQQFAASMRDIGNELMPVFADTAERLAKFAREEKESLTEFGQFAADAGLAFANGLVAIKNFFQFVDEKTKIFSGPAEMVQKGIAAAAEVTGLGPKGFVDTLTRQMEGGLRNDPEFIRLSDNLARMSEAMVMIQQSNMQLNERQVKLQAVQARHAEDSTSLQRVIAKYNKKTSDAVGN